MKRLEDLYSEMEKKKSFKCGDGASIEDIEAAQTALGLEFPWDYRAFLSKYSYAQWFGEFITGITEDKTVGVVSHSLYKRNGFGCPPSAIVLDTDSMMFCRDPDDFMIRGGIGTFRSFAAWVDSKL